MKIRHPFWIFSTTRKEGTHHILYLQYFSVISETLCEKSAIYEPFLKIWPPYWIYANVDVEEIACSQQQSYFCIQTRKFCFVFLNCLSTLALLMNRPSFLYQQVNKSVTRHWRCNGHTEDRCSVIGRHLLRSDHDSILPSFRTCSWHPESQKSTQYFWAAILDLC